MYIVAVFPPYLYSVVYGVEDKDNDKPDEYHRLMDLWTDVDYLSVYFNANCSKMDPSIWKGAIEPEIAASNAYDEAYGLEKRIEEYHRNAALRHRPDFDVLFKPLDGEYVYEWELVPMKAYGPRKPSFLRLYAIKMESNCYLITGGAIKICRSMQDSPELINELSKIKSVRSFLREQGIENQEDL